MNRSSDSGWPACHSALRLDRWILGELSPEEAAALSSHVAGCGRCREAVDALADARDRTELPPLRRPPAARPARWRGVAVAALAASIAGVVLSRLPAQDRYRTKGRDEPVLSMYVQHAGEVRRAELDDRVSPGDAVRFAVTLQHPSYVAVLSLDPLGHASVYYPAGPRAEPVAPATPGAEVALPLSTRLDETVGRERVFALFCDGPVELEPVRARLDAVAAGLVPAGCQVTRWTFEKR